MYATHSLTGLLSNILTTGQHRPTNYAHPVFQGLAVSQSLHPGYTSRPTATAVDRSSMHRLPGSKPTQAMDSNAKAVAETTHESNESALLTVSPLPPHVLYVESPVLRRGCR